MGNLKNIPIDAGIELAQLVNGKENQVISKALSNSECVQITVLAFSNGETISMESYFGDTCYYVIQNKMKILYEKSEILLCEGEVLMVPAGALHGIYAEGDLKILQITIQQ